jgi:hypothetical protein
MIDGERGVPSEQMQARVVIHSLEPSCRLEITPPLSYCLLLKILLDLLRILSKKPFSSILKM